MSILHISAAVLRNQGRRFSLSSTKSAAHGGNHMKEIIVIRTSDPDGSVFRAILGALQGKDVQVLHDADLDPSTLTLGDIEIFPEQRRVTKAGVEICLNYGEFSILYCMARCPGRVFSREQLYNAAWGEDYELGPIPWITRSGGYGASWSLTPGAPPTSKPFFGWDIKLRDRLIAREHLPAFSLPAPSAPAPPQRIFR